MSPVDRIVPDGPVIVGVDPAERARDAIALGQQLAIGLSSETEPVFVHSLEALDSLLSGGRLQEVDDLVASDGEAKLSQVREITAQMGVEEVRMRRAATPAEGLHAEIQASDASLVVLGSSQRSGLGRLLPGGTAERLFSASPVAVAIAPRGYADRPQRRKTIGAGFDKSPESELAVRWAADIAARNGASLHLIAVHAPIPFGGMAAGANWGTMNVNEVLGRELKASMDALASELSSELAVETHMLRGEPVVALAERSKELDLLVLGSRGYGPVKSVLLGSVSSRVIKEAECPVLVVPK